MRRSLRIIFLIILLYAGRGRLKAQTSSSVGSSDGPTHMVRIYEDDDFINIWGQGSDNQYTNGTRLDYFYNPGHTLHGLINRIMPRSGDSSINIYGWGIVQLMYTPDDYSNRAYLPRDYPYSGALFASHTLYSYNPSKKYSFQSELSLGVIGPASLAAQTQKLVHQIEGFETPEGWGHQFSNAPLLNVNFTAEKQLAHVGSVIEVIGGTRASLGTFQNGVSLYPLIRIGRMTPYFKGYLSQYSGSLYNRHGQKKWQLYFFAKPEVRLVFTDALVQGGIFTSNPNLKKNTADPNLSDKNESAAADAAAPLPYPALNHVTSTLTYGAVATNGNFGISFNQSTSSALLKGLYCHQTGNISLYFSW